jgi:hypothetical protein
VDKPALKLNAKTPRCKGAEKKLGVVAALSLCVEFFAFVQIFNGLGTKNDETIYWADCTTEPFL